MKPDVSLRIGFGCIYQQWNDTEVLFSCCLYVEVGRPEPLVTLWSHSGPPLLPFFLTMAATLSNSLCSKSTAGFLGFPAITSLWRVIWRTTKNEKLCTLKSSRHFHLCVTGQNLACDQSHYKGGWKSGESVFSSERHELGKTHGPVTKEEGKNGRDKTMAVSVTVRYLF